MRSENGKARCHPTSLARSRQSPLPYRSSLLGGLLLPMKLEYLHRWLEKHNPHFPEVKIWGAGRITRSRAQFLSDAGTVISGFYDVDPRKVGNPRTGLMVQSIEDIPEPGEEFIVAMVGARGAREKVGAFLRDRGHRRVSTMCSLHKNIFRRSVFSACGERSSGVRLLFSNNPAIRQ